MLSTQQLGDSVDVLLLPELSMIVIVGFACCKHGDGL